MREFTSASAGTERKVFDHAPEKKRRVSPGKENRHRGFSKRPGRLSDGAVLIMNLDEILQQHEHSESKTPGGKSRFWILARNIRCRAYQGAMKTRTPPLAIARV
jgi:hypothetical protein